MEIENVFRAAADFEILQTTGRIQAGTVALEPGGETSSDLNAHSSSEQVLLVLEGEMRAQVGEEAHTLAKGDFVIVPRATPHKFSNPGRVRAVAFTAYAPPAY